MDGATLYGYSTIHGCVHIVTDFHYRKNRNPIPSGFDSLIVNVFCILY